MPLLMAHWQSYDLGLSMVSMRIREDLKRTIKGAVEMPTDMKG